MGRETFQQKPAGAARIISNDMRIFSVSLLWGMQWCNRPKDCKSSNNIKFAALLVKLPWTRRQNPIQDAAGINKTIWYCAVLGITDFQITFLPWNSVEGCSSHLVWAGSESSAAVSDTWCVTSARLSCAVSEEQSCSLNRNTQTLPWLLTAQLDWSQNCLEHLGAQT